MMVRFEIIDALYQKSQVKSHYVMNNISMQKFIFLTVLSILSSCTYSSNEPVVIYENLPQYSDQSIRQITGFMEILDTDINYPVVYDILTRSEKPCI